MAIEAGGQRFCKVSAYHKGRPVTMRVHKIVVHDSNGHPEYYEEGDLPNAITLFEKPRGGRRTAAIWQQQVQRHDERIVILVESKPPLLTLRDITVMGALLAVMGVLKLMTYAAVASAQ